MRKIIDPFNISEIMMPARRVAISGYPRPPSITYLELSLCIHID